MAVTAVRDQAFRFLHGVVEIFRAVQSEHGGKFFVRERLFEFHALHFSDEDLGRRRHGKAADLGDLCRALSHDLGVERAVDDDGIAHFIRFVAL